MAEYINKSTLLKSFAPIYEHDRYTGLTFETAKQIITDHINSFPTIDAEPVRHGHWIFNPKDAIEAMFTLPKCSECGAESADGGNYCSNCGAKMDLEKENEID